MKSVLWPLVVSFLFAAQAVAAPGGEPGFVPSVGNWRIHDAREPAPGAEPWPVPIAAGLLERHPDAVLDLGYRDGQPPGNRYWLEKGAETDELQAFAADAGIPVDGRLCVTERPDVITRFNESEGSCSPRSGGVGCDWEGDMDGSFRETESVSKLDGVASGGSDTALYDAAATWGESAYRHRLLVIRPGTADEERRRIVAHGRGELAVDRAWIDAPKAGDAYEIRGSFDPAWLKRIPSATHRATVQRFWQGLRSVCGPDAACEPPAEPLDPFDPGNRRSWPRWFDREAITSLVTPSSVPVLYGLVADEGTSRRYWEDPFFQLSAVVADLADPAYRAWRVRYALYKLRDYGIDPGERACLIVAYKPGWHAYWNEAENGPGNEACSVSGTNSWTGPAHVCSDGSSPGGPFAPSPYGAGEFEAGLNAYLRELVRVLEANGHPDPRIITVERPRYTRRVWSLLEADVRHMSALEGEWAGALEPSVAELGERSTPGGGGESAPVGGGSGTPSSGGTTSPGGSGSPQAGGSSGLPTSGGSGDPIGGTPAPPTGTGGSSSGDGGSPSGSSSQPSGGGGLPAGGVGSSSDGDVGGGSIPADLGDGSEPSTGRAPAAAPAPPAPESSGATRSSPVDRMRRSSGGSGSGKVNPIDVP